MHLAVSEAHSPLWDSQLHWLLQGALVGLLLLLGSHQLILSSGHREGGLSQASGKDTEIPRSQPFVLIY